MEKQGPTDKEKGVNQIDVIAGAVTDPAAMEMARKLAGVEVVPEVEGKKDEEARFMELMGGKDSPVMIARANLERTLRAVGKLGHKARIEALGGKEYIDAHIQVQNKLISEGVDITQGEGKELLNRFTRWCLMEEEEKKKAKSEVPMKTAVPGAIQVGASEPEVQPGRNFTDEEEILIIQNCLDQIFVGGKRDLYEIKKALLGGEGFIAVNLRGGKEIPLDKELLSKIELLGVHAWADIRDTVSKWASFKDLEEIKPASLTGDLFLDSSTEKFLAKNAGYLPWRNEKTGKVELQKVEFGHEIGLAMKRIREYFEGSVDEDGKRVTREYWWMIGADLGQKEKLYTELGLNRYIGEAAFSLLLSYQMLTDTSADDYMSMMVQQAKTRPNKYKISEERDPFVRMIVQADLVRGIPPFTNLTGEGMKLSKAAMEERLARLLPSQLIPTGMSLANGVGEEKLREGKWLEWRIDENIFTRAELDAAPEGKKRPATDQDTRLAMMRSALTVLTMIKEIQDPSSDIAKLASLTSKLYSHSKSSMGDAYWLIKDGDTLWVPADLSPRNARGEKAPMELREWVSRTMLTVSEMFLYTHSLVDHKNPKPWDMFAFTNNLEAVFALEPQSGKESFVGMSPVAKRNHRRELLDFARRIWANSEKITNAVDSLVGNNPARYPEWYRTRVRVGPGVQEAVTKSRGALKNWLNTIKRLEKEV